LGKGKAANQIARDAGISPYPIQKAQRLAAKLDRDKLLAMINTAAEFDYKSKTVTFDLDEALKTYIAAL
jgi:DNA polymerase III delta subunit